jgi:hypothetical protein
MAKNLKEGFAGFSMVRPESPTLTNGTPLPLVSIVTPSFNQGRFIRETIESVLNQDYPSIEYWVIDGGSNDGTVEILKDYEHDLRFHWISEKDNGQSDAINKGLSRCRGEIFNWLASDDLLLPGALRHVASTWVSCPQPSVVYGWARLIDQNGKDLGYCPLQSSEMTLQKMLRSDAFPMQQATFAPTESVRAVSGVDPSLDYAMDLDLWIKLIEKLPFRHVPFDLALYRLHETSKTVSLSSRFIDDVARILESAASRNLLSESQAYSYSQLFAAKVYLTPEAWNLKEALRRLGYALKLNPTLGPTVVFVLLKGIARAIVGEEPWSKIRAARVVRSR